MHDDPTRTMGQPQPPDGRPHGNMRLFVAGLIAVIAGLVIAIVVIASGGDDTPSTVTVPAVSETTTAPTATGTTTTGTTAPTGTTTKPTETTQPTTTAPPPTTPEEETGSGGISPE